MSEALEMTNIPHEQSIQAQPPDSCDALVDVNDSTPMVMSTLNSCDVLNVATDNFSQGSSSKR